MYKAASRLRALKGRAGNVGATRFATSAAAIKPASGGIFSWLTGESSSTLPPLETQLQPSKTQITTLSNGVKIASETSPSPAASIGLYVDSGSIYETPESSGASHLLERLAFKSTTNRSHLRIVREVEAIGGHIGASASREQMGYTFDAIKTYVPQMVELLVDAVRNPAFLEWEVNEELKKVRAEIGELSNNPQGLLLEAIHSAGYSGALANPLLASEAALNRLNGSVLEDFVAENYTARRIVLAASGVDHEEIVSIAGPLLSDLPSGPHSEEPQSKYVGGEYRLQASPSETHIALAFEVPGGWRQEKQAILLTFSSCLWEVVVLSLPGDLERGCTQGYSFSAFNSIFNDSGLFGIYASSASEFGSELVDIAAKELLSIATPGQVTDVQLKRAKESTKAAVLMNLESRMIASEDIGRQVLTYGERKPVEHFLKTVEEVSLTDITTIAQKIISSPLTMASFGNEYRGKIEGKEVKMRVKMGLREDERGRREKK
ncbi:Insulinase Peptidase family M16 protein [Prunus dulcis]|uniref:Insulinase Peptidase family M16 protein n=1 Tax=Prunus dulcis TaxID=3755 RepID=A0A4Y1R492_PRUDU|nr:Insulinase Peptidase family M16 protein [Prunus dulcis]